MNKVVYIPAPFKVLGKDVIKTIPTGVKKRGMFGGEKDMTKNVMEWVQTGYSDCEIDGEALAKNISKAVSELNSEGYKVVQISPVISGRYNWNLDSITKCNIRG